MRVLFTTLFSNDLGLPTRTLPIAMEMAKCGHTVAFCNPAPGPSRLIRDAGLPNLPYSGPAPGLRAPATRDIWNVDHLMARIGYLDEQYVRAVCRNLMTIITDYRADLVVDSFNLAACLATRILRKPLVTVIQGDQHPAGRGFIWWREPPAEIPSPVAVLNALLEEHGLNPVEKSNELFVGDLTLVTGIPETDPLPEGTQVTYLGPLLWQNPKATAPEWFDTPDPKKPLVWVYTGTLRYGKTPMIGDSIVVYRTVTDALARENVQVLFTSGYQSLPEETASLPPNFYFTPYVPGLATARRSSLMIHHGGHCSCLMGLSAGTPALIVPTFSERESNARRIAVVGAGRVLIPEEELTGEMSLSPEELRNNVMDMLADPVYTLSAKRISRIMKEYDQVSVAARMIEELAGR